MDWTSIMARHDKKWLIILSRGAGSRQHHEELPIRFQESEIKLNPSTTTAKTFSDFPENVISDSSYTVV